MYFIIIAIGIILDQFIKWLVVTNINWGEISANLGFFKLTYVRNEGAAFGIFGGGTEILTIATGVFLICLIVFLLFQKNKQSKLVLWAVAFIIAGGIGNFIDRVLRGYVVDYLSFWSFPVFNLADILVVTGAGLVILYLIFFDGKNNKNKKINEKQECKENKEREETNNA